MNSKTLNRTLLIIKLYREKATNRFIKMKSKCTAYQRQIFISDKAVNEQIILILLTPAHVRKHHFIYRCNTFPEPNIFIFTTGAPLQYTGPFLKLLHFKGD